jgi:GNAT superfamily N-acetyltransferase/uncharacterized protein (DUF736 family)
VDKDVHLKPMDPERLAAWNAGKRSEAEDGLVRIGTSPEAGGIILDVTMDDVPPSTSATTEQHVWSVVHGGAEIGSAWVRVQHRRHTESWAYVYEFDVSSASSPHVGSAALAALEHEVGRQGASHIQLKAPADSRRLFEQRGYDVALLEISKPVTGGPPIDYDNPPEVRLQPLNQQQYDDYLLDLTADFAETSPAESPEAAMADARRQVHQLTAGPLRPKLQAFLGGYYGDELVGRVWIVLEQAPDGLHSFTNDMRVEPEMRARGYGRGFMAAVYEHLKEIGVITNRGKVYGSNVRAQALFKQAGYEVTHVHVKKRLAAG